MKCKPYTPSILSLLHSMPKTNSWLPRLYCQPEASLAMFKRVLADKDLATGDVDLAGTYETNGDASATHTEPFAALTSTAIVTRVTATASLVMSAETMVQVKYF
jgi:hypothetical protein